MTAAPRAILVAALVAACGGGGGGSSPPAEAPPDLPVPVALNADSPFGYPPALYEQRVQGEVVLRLFVDSAGRVVSESTRVAETSGHPALDSAALAGASGLRFAPATRRGVAVAAEFLQPVRFRRPDSTTAAPGGP